MVITKLEDSKKQEPPQVGKDTLEESDSKFVEGLVESNTIPKYLRGPLSSVIKSRRDMVKAISNPVKQEVRAFGDELEKTDIPLGQKADIQTGTSGSYNRHRSLTMELVETDIESLQTSGVDILVERIGTEKSDD